MIDFLLSLIEQNEAINYKLIVSVVLGYVLFLWFIVCIWVFFDAKKRYSSIYSSFFFMIFVLIFGIPAILFYILIRPEHTLEEEYYINLALSGEKELKPILFDGDRGFDISINFSVQPKENENDKHKMMMNVEWMPSRKGSFEFKKSEELIKKGKKLEISKFRDKIISNLNRKIKSLKARINEIEEKRKQKKDELKKKKEEEKKAKIEKEKAKGEEKKKLEEQKNNKKLDKIVDGKVQKEKK